MVQLQMPWHQGLSGRAGTEGGEGAKEAQNSRRSIWEPAPAEGTFGLNLVNVRHLEVSQVEELQKGRHLSLELRRELGLETLLGKCRAGEARTPGCQ